MATYGTDKSTNCSLPFHAQAAQHELLGARAPQASGAGDEEREWGGRPEALHRGPRDGQLVQWPRARAARL